MKRNNCPIGNSGFTLVELLVVISIIAILAGAAFMVINPTQLQRKSREAVLKAKTSQICLALSGCAAAKDSATLCNEEAELGIPSLAALSDPPTATYTLVPSLPSPVGATSTLTVTGTYGACIYECNFNFSDGSSLKLGVRPGATCL